VQWGSKRCLAKYPLPQPLVEAIAAARERLGRSESLLTALANAVEGNDEASDVSHGSTEASQPVAAADGQASPDASPVDSSVGSHADESATEPPAPPPGFVEHFDARAVRTQAERFAPYQEILVDWLRSDVLPLERLNLSLPAEQPALSPADEPEGHLRAVWNWPEARISEQCILAVCSTAPKLGDDPEQLATHWRQSISAEQWAAGGSAWLIPCEKNWEGSSVTVWAVVDLGFRKLFSPPLILGQIESRSRWKWPRLFARRSESEEPT
jgi:hypothetical protein